MLWEMTFPILRTGRNGLQSAEVDYARPKNFLKTVSSGPIGLSGRRMRFCPAVKLENNYNKGPTK